MLRYVNFVDNDYFSILESAIIQTCGKEVIWYPTGKEYLDNKIKDLFLKCGLTLTECKKKDFGTKFEDSTNQLEKLLKKTVSLDFSSKELTEALPCVSALINYLELTADVNNFGYFLMEVMNLDEFMRLETTALRALNILKSPGESKTMSLYGLLDVCITKIGSRKLEEWIRQPLIKSDEIERRLDVVEAFVEDSTLLEKFRSQVLRGVPDLDGILKRFQRMKGGLKDMVKLYYFLQNINVIIEALDSYEGSHKTLLETLFIKPLKNTLSDFAGLIKLTEDCVDLERTKKNEYLILSGFDEELDLIREKRLAIEGEINALKKELLGHLNDDVQLEKNPANGQVFRVTQNHEDDLIELVEGLEIISQKSKKIYFTFPRLRELSGDFDEITVQYLKQQSTLEKKMTGVFASYIPPAEELARLIVHLDILSSFASVAVNAPLQYNRPNIQESNFGRMILREARHPCLEVQDNVSFIPNNIEFNQNKKSFWIVTGPNMSGKSTFIRQLAVITLMAQIGSFVPCSEALISIRESILTRIGASDSQIRGVSTFMAEMLETSTILRSANEKSLVIVDELGRGTSSYDGFGLAYAIAKSIATKNKSFCVFATHFHELAKLEYQVPQIGNKHVTAHVDEKNIVMLYQVKEGPTDQSFGIHVAKLANFPNEVVSLAEKRVRELEGEESQTKKKKLCDPNAEKKIVQDVIQYCRIDFTSPDPNVIQGALEQIFGEQ